MSLDPQSTSLLHPDQVSTVSQAACWVQHLIDCYTQNVRTLQPFTLDEAALQDYAARLETLLGHAGVLEQLLCRMCFFLPEQVVRTVIAIIVATHRQVSLLQSDTLVGTHSPRFILEGRLLKDMANYLESIVAKLFATHDWVQSDEYARLRGAVEEALFQMRESLSLFISNVHMTDSYAEPGLSPLPARMTGEDGYPENIHASLNSFLSTWSPSHCTSESIGLSDLPDADWDLFYTNFKPLALSDLPPYLNPDFYACGDGESEDGKSSSGSSSLTVYSDAVPPGKAEDLFPLSPMEDAPFNNSWSTPPTPPPTYVPPTMRYEHPAFTSFQSTSAPTRPRPKLKRRHDTEDLGHSVPKPKKQRVSVTLYGVDGCVTECSTHEAVVARVQPFIGRAIRLTPGLSPSKLPQSRRFYEHVKPDTTSLASCSSSSSSSSSFSDDSDSEPPSPMSSNSPYLNISPASLPPIPPTFWGDDGDDDDGDRESERASSVAATCGDSESDRCIPASKASDSYTACTWGTAQQEPASMFEKRSCWAGLLSAVQRFFNA